MFYGPIAIGLAGLILAWAVITFNSLVRSRNAVEQAFGSIDAMLKRRYDLIPNLVACVSQYVAHEKGLLTEVTALRSQATSGRLDANSSLEVNARLSARLRQLAVAVEAYPQLRASENFLQLQASLNEVEEQLAASRRAYNAAVVAYNNAVETVPTSLLALCIGWKRRTVFSTGEPERATPSVRALFEADSKGA
jgi:LemA protein